MEHFGKSLIAVVLAGFACLSPAAAQGLQDSLKLAWERNPALQAARAGLDATGEQIVQARAGGMPKINGQIGYEFSDGSYDPGSEVDFDAIFGGNDTGLGAVLDGLTGNAGFGSTSAGLEISQPLFQGFRVRNGIREAEARLAAAEAGFAGTTQQLFAATIQTYLAIGSAEEAVRVADTRLNLLDQQMRAAEISFEVGQSTKTDLAQIRASLEGAKAQRIAALSDLGAARQQFARLTGQMPVNINPAPPLPVLPENAEAALEQALADNPDLISARAEEDAAAQAVKVAKGYLSPSLSAKATAGYSRDSFIQGDEAANYTIGATLTVPVWQGGATHSAIRRARAGLNAARYNRLDTENAVREQVETAWQRMEAARAALTAREAAMAANELAYEGIQLEREVGQRSILDVLSTETTWAESRLDAIRARADYQLACYALLQVTGALTPEGLGIAK